MILTFRTMYYLEVNFQAYAIFQETTREKNAANLYYFLRFIILCKTFNFDGTWPWKCKFAVNSETVTETAIYNPCMDLDYKT